MDRFKRLLLIITSLALISTVAFAGNTIIQNGNVITDVFTATTLTVEEVSGHMVKGILDFSNNRAVNLADPQRPQDAATKKYVDQKIGEIEEKYRPDLPYCDYLGYNPSGSSGDIYACGSDGCVNMLGDSMRRCSGRLGAGKGKIAHRQYGRWFRTCDLVFDSKDKTRLLAVGSLYTGMGKADLSRGSSYSSCAGYASAFQAGRFLWGKRGKIKYTEQYGTDRTCDVCLKR